MDVRIGPESGMVGLAPKWVRFDPKLDKSGAFSDQISVHLAYRDLYNQNIENYGHLDVHRYNALLLYRGEESYKQLSN